MRSTNPSRRRAVKTQARCDLNHRGDLLPGWPLRCLRPATEAGILDEAGGPPGDRTRDTLIKSQVLYH